MTLPICHALFAFFCFVSASGTCARCCWLPLELRVVASLLLGLGRCVITNTRRRHQSFLVQGLFARGGFVASGTFARDGFVASGRLARFVASFGLARAVLPVWAC